MSLFSTGGVGGTCAMAAVCHGGPLTSPFSLAGYLDTGLEKITESLPLVKENFATGR